MSASLNLEDHLGDVVRKARANAGATLASVARAAGLTASELALFEESGHPPRPIQFGALGAALGLNPARLEALAAGWRPRPRDLDRWRRLRQIATTQGGNTVNCFLVWDENTREAALFDTGWEAGPVLQVVRDCRLTLRHLFITHGHHDHVAAAGPIQERAPGLHIHRGGPHAHAVHRGGAGIPSALGGLRVEARAVPGHAEDGMIYVVSGWPGGAPHAAFVGDTIFAGSLAKGFVSAAQLREKTREQILTLPPETLLCPGHGPVTTVAEEIAHNPFF